MMQRIADDFQSIAASLKKLERDKEAAVNSPARANERLIREADEARERAKKLPPGPERDALLKRARQAEITQRWLSSSELKPPD
jgi:DNA anti-recombination protein RmuC